MRDRYLDACGPFVLQPPDGIALGAFVETRLETLDLGRGTLVLEVQVERDDDDNVGDASPPVMLTCLLHTGACTPNDDNAVAFLAEQPWFEAQLETEMNRVRRRAWRAAAQRDRETAARVLATAESGKMIAFHALFPADWDLLLGHEDTFYWVVDQYCPNPACECTSVALTLYELRAATPPLRVGEAQLDLVGKRAALDVMTPPARELFIAFQDEYEETVRERRDETRRAVLRNASSRSKVASVDTSIVASPVVSRAPRNATCPCGSGKKYKRCCLRASPGSGISAPRS